jgi:phosphate transport system protein
MPVTRVHYQEELDRLEERTLEGLDMVITTLDRTLEAVQQQDVELAGVVVADDDRIDGRYLEVHQSILTLLATQAPVATDLRLIAALLDAMKVIERMGDQCVNIAKLVRISEETDPEGSDEMLGRIARMGAQVRTQIGSAKQAFATRDAELARDLPRGDDLIDDLNRQCFVVALEMGEEQAAREWAMTMMLVARALERTGDYAVDIGEQVAFLVTGLFEEFEDASHP